MPNIINLTVDDTTQTVNVTVSDGLVTPSGALFISGFLVKKGSGNVDTTAIEVDDYVIGWINDTWAAGKVASIPVTTTSNLTTAVQGEVL